jgi:hypothetical protein
MKVHKFRPTSTDAITESMLYVPGQGIVRYDELWEETISFSDDTESMNRFDELAKGKTNPDGPLYLGEVDLPEAAVSGMIHSGKALKIAKENFDRFTKNLLDLLEN